MTKAKVITDSLIEFEKGEIVTYKELDKGSHYDNRGFDFIIYGNGGQKYAYVTEDEIEPVKED